MNTRPRDDEFAPFYRPYVERVPDGDLLETLESELHRTIELLDPLDDEAGAHRYAEGKWSLKEVLGHVVDGERAFALRALAFARSDPEPFPSFDEQLYVRTGRFDARDLDSLLEEFRLVRLSTLALLRSFPPDVWDRRGTASGCEFTTRAQAWILAGHQAHHADVMEERYLGEARRAGENRGEQGRAR